MLITAGSVPLAQCASTLSGELRLDPPDASLTQTCAPPVDLPNRELTQAEVERFWGQDRAALIVCRDRLSGLVRYYAVRDAALTE